MVKQNFRSKANRLEELKNVYRLFPFSCPRPTAAAVEQVQWAVVRCCMYLFWMIFLGACICFFMSPVFSAHTLFWPTLWTSTSLSPKVFTKWVMWMAAVTWFNTICSKPFQTGFQSETIGCKYPKPYFRVIPLFLELWKLTCGLKSCLYNYPIFIHTIKRANLTIENSAIEASWTITIKRVFDLAIKVRGSIN